MNPVPVMKLVEVIKGLQTSQETLQNTIDLADMLQKETSIAKDYPGKPNSHSNFRFYCQQNFMSLHK